MFIFFFCIFLPLTPNLLKVSISCGSESDCVTALNFVALAAADIIPVLLILIDYFVVDHRFCFRNAWIELSVINGFILVIVILNAITAGLSLEWSFQVESFFDDNKAGGALVHLSLFGICIFVYFILQYLHSIISNSIPNRAHYTDDLLSSEAWEPRIQQFEITTYDLQNQQHKPFGHSPDTNLQTAVSSIDTEVDKVFQTLS